MTNIVRNQGIAIKELNKAIKTKIDKSEIQYDLNSKCDKNEINQIVLDLKKMINEKPSNEQLNNLVKDKISKNEVLFYLSNKPSADDINNILEEKIGIREFEEVLNQINILKNDKIDTNIFNSEIKEIKEILENKSNSIDVINALDTKVDKEELSIELKNISYKNESNNISKIKEDKIENEKIYELLNEKISIKEFKKFEKIEDILKDKADNNDFNLIKDAFKDMKEKFTLRIDEIDNDLDRLIENIKLQFKSMDEDIKKLENNISENSLDKKMNHILINKTNFYDIDEKINLLKNNIFQSMNSFMNEIGTNQKNFEEKIMSNLDKILKENKYIMENMNIQSITLDDLFNNKKNYENKITELNSSEIIKNISDTKLEIKKDMENILNILNNKIDIKDFNKEIAKIENEIEDKINSLNENKDNNIILEVNNKIKKMYEDISKELENKISMNDVKLLLNGKDNYKKINEINNNLDNKKLDDIKTELKQKLDISFFNKVINQFNLNFENIKKDIIDSKIIEEMNNSLQTKINHEQFNKFKLDIIKKLNEKVNTNDFTTSIDNQSIINDTLCKENCIGRWMWKSGIIKNNYIIPWENQLVNTFPDNFIWEKDKNFIMVNEEGLYELNIGLYSDKKPSIQVLVNGEIIINSQKNNIMNKKLIGKNEESNDIIGLSIIEFVMMKKESKISVLFYGGKGSGFIGLKKL